MRNTVLWCCMSILSTVLIIGSCTNTYGEFDLSQSPIGFLKGLNEITVSFPTDDPNKDVRLKFKKKQGATRPTLSQALNFIRQNMGYKERYQRDIYDCKQFAHKLFEDAQKENFEAHFVILKLKNEPEGHALTAIHTVDAGMLYVDFTPFLTGDSSQKPSQTIAFVKEGHPYIRIPIEALGSRFANTQFDFENFQATIERGDKEIQNFNQQVTSLEEQKKAVEARVGNFNAKVQQVHVSAAHYENVLSEQDQLKREVEEINSRYDHLNFEQARIQNMYFFTDWVGKTWVVDSYKLVP
jgi:hypothetical protein